MQKKKNILTFSLMIIIGIGLIVFGIISNKKTKNFIEICEETTGTVIGYSTSNDDGKTKYRAKYKYEVDGETYSVTEQKYHSIKPRDGETDTIYYDPNNPEDARTRLRNGNPVVIATGVVLIIAGAFAVFTLVKRK